MLWVVAMVVVLVAAGCGNSEPESSADTSGSSSDDTTGGSGGTVDLDANIPSDQPGVTDTEIRVGGVVSATNPLGGGYADAFAGTQAYFDMINEAGGIYGRELTLVAERDDTVSQNQSEVQAMLA